MSRSFLVLDPRSLKYQKVKGLLLRNCLADQVEIFVEPLWVVELKFCSPYLGHMTKMAAMPTYGKNPTIIFSRTSGPISMKLCM